MSLISINFLFELWILIFLLLVAANRIPPPFFSPLSSFPLFYVDDKLFPIICFCTCVDSLTISTIWL